MHRRHLALVERIFDSIVEQVARQYGIPTAVIYRSASSSHARYVEILHNQEDICFDYCIAKNIIVLEDYCNDEDDDRNYGLLGAIDFCEETNVDYFIVKSISEISKDGSEIRKIHRILNDHGTTILPIQRSTRDLDSLELNPLSSREI